MFQDYIDDQTIAYIHNPATRSVSRGAKLSAEDQAKLRAVYMAVTNKGHVFCDDDQSIRFLGLGELTDTITSESMSRFFPPTIEIILREAIEPLCVVERTLFQPYPLGVTDLVEIGALGAVSVGRIGEGGEYPTVSLQMDGGNRVAASWAKWGLKIPITQEAKESDSFGLLNLMLKAASMAFARHSEIAAIKALSETSILYYSNDAPAQSVFGVLTGRGIDGVQNGTCSLNDIVRALAEMMLRGYNPSHAVISPLSWAMFMTDPEIREVLMGPGNVITSMRGPDGNASPGWGTTHQGLGYVTRWGGSMTQGPNPFATTPNPLNATFQIAPNGLARPLTILVSPFVRFSASATFNIPGGGTVTKSIGDLVLADQTRCGIRATKSPIRMAEWDDKERDVTFVKMDERYGHMVLDEGKGIGFISSAVIDRNFTFENTNVVSLSTIDKTTTLIA